MPMCTQELNNAVLNRMRERYVKPKRSPLFRCQECGKPFYTVAAAERAANNRCPKCGGCDIDLV